MGTQISSSLFWIVNGSTVATYVFRDDNRFPRDVPVNPPLDGVTVVVNAAFTNPPRATTIDVMSELRASNVSVLNKASLQCETSVGENIRSNTLNVEVYYLCK